MSDTLPARFWSKVAKGPWCWIWTAARSPHGYGRVNVAGRSLQAHRVSWEMCKGEIPLGLHVLHHCDVRPCVNPSHLFLGTNADNIRDMHAKGRNRQPRGEANTNGKLTEDDVREIRRIYAESEISASALGRKFGVCHPTVVNIVRGRGWRHVV